MRIKDTLLTVIAAGIVFLGGMIMLGKNPFSKKEYRKKDYIVVPEEEVLGEASLAHIENKVPIHTETTIEDVTVQVKQEKELLSLLREVILNNTKKEVIMPFKEKGIRAHREKQLSSTHIAHHVTITQDKKQLHKIREPSINYSINEKANFKIVNNDKGG